MTGHAVLLKVADGITAELAAALEEGEFEGLSFQSERSYADWKDDELEDLDCLKLDVVPVRHEKSELDDRGSTLYLCSNDIGVRKKFSPKANAQSGRIRRDEIDRLVLLVEEIHEFFLRPDPDDGTPLGTRLREYPEATWKETNIRTTFSRRHLRDMRMFLGVIRVVYEASKAL